LRGEPGRAGRRQHQTGAGAKPSGGARRPSGCGACWQRARDLGWATSMASAGLQSGSAAPGEIAGQAFAHSGRRPARWGGVGIAREAAPCADSCSRRARQIDLEVFLNARNHENHAQMIFRFNQLLLFFSSVSFRLFLVVICSFFIGMAG